MEVSALQRSKTLRPLSQKQGQWAFRKCIDHFAYRLPKGRTTCMDCGASWQMDRASTHCTCPHCKARLEVKNTLERKCEQRQYFSVLTTKQGYEVLRMFLLEVKMEKGQRAQTRTIEVGQYWWDEKGKTCLIARPRTMGRYIDSFALYTPLAVRNDHEAYRYVAQAPIYSRRKVTAQLKRNGFQGEMHDLQPTLLIPALLSDSRVETLYKGGAFEHLRYFLSKDHSLEHYWQAYKVAMRQRYTISDIALWCDHVDMLRRLGKDTHNAHFLCPKDLQEAHDRVQKKLQKERDKAAEAQRRAKALADEARFQQLKAPFFGISFTDGTIQVKVLESVQEYLEEGASLHHCVFTNEYYLKQQSLILSARIEGKRIETIEVSLETMQVIQCRGLQNRNTEYHDRIIRLVHQNIGQIQARIA